MYKTMIHRTAITISQGDITKQENLDAVCIPMNSDAKMQGGSSLAIKMRGGIEIEEELKSKKPLRIGRAIATNAGTLQYKRIIHGIIMPHVGSKFTDKTSIYSSIQSALGICDRENLRSVAFTLFATGFGGWTPSLSSKIMIEAIINYIKSGTRIRDIRIVAFERKHGIFQKSLLEAFVSKGHLKANPAVIVVDMVNDFFGQGKIINETEAKKLSIKINELLKNAKKFNVPIIFLNDSHNSIDDFEFTRTPVHSIAGSNGSKIINLIDYKEEQIINKSRYDGFFKTDLGEVLAEKEINTLIFCGMQTHVCVLLTALSAFYRGFHPIIVRDSTASSSPDKHELGLWYLERYGGDTANNEDVFSLFEIMKLKELEK